MGESSRWNGGQQHGGGGWTPWAVGMPLLYIENGNFRGISPNRQNNMLLGIYDPTIIHDLQNSVRYWKSVISNQSL